MIEQAIGRCVDNAEEVDKPMYLCKGDGKWYLPTGGCKCKAGFEADLEKQTCNGKCAKNVNFEACLRQRRRKERRTSMGDRFRLNI